MIKIKLYELEKHRNETTFRPLLFEKKLFNEIGIEFVTKGNADFAFIAQSSVTDKKLPLEKSIEKGLNFLKTVEEPYFLIDGQDSTSLIGTYDVFKQSNAILLLKNNILKDRSLYKNKYVNGRYFWGSGNYSCDDIDEYNSKIVLSGFSWLNTFGNNLQIQSVSKNRKHDVCCLIGLSKENYEHGIRTDFYYNSTREKIFENVRKLNCDTITTEKSGKLNRDEYYKTLMNSKICISPYGYGEIAIRDIEAWSAGCIIIKPTMSFVDTMPNMYHDGNTYIVCKSDYSDLEEKVDFTLKNYKELQTYFYKNINKILTEEFNSYKIVKHYYDIFLKNTNVTT